MVTETNPPSTPDIAPSNMPTPPRKPLSLFKKIVIVVFLIVSSFGVYDIFFPSQPPAPPATNEAKQTLSKTPSIQQKPASNWKTYTNTKYNYAIDYPNDLVYRQFPDTETGAGFRLASKPNDLCCEIITIDYSPKMANDKDLPFENYVTIAGTGIQNYQKLDSSKKITTTTGIIGYITTWQVTPITGGPSQQSAPITFFPAKDNPDGLIMITLQNTKDPKQVDIYNKMIATFRYNGK